MPDIAESGVVSGVVAAIERSGVVSHAKPADHPAAPEFTAPEFTAIHFTDGTAV